MSKSLLITGGSRGIGASIVELAAASGYKVFFTYNTKAAEAHSLASSVSNKGGEAHSFQLDVTQQKDVESLFTTINAEFGPLSALVNNAGVVDLASRMESISVERLQRIFAVNFFGSFYCCQQAVKHMSPKYGGKGGSIVNVSSIASRMGAPNEYIDYASAKAAVDTLTMGLAKEVAEENIRVNCVRPGLIDTDLHAVSGDRLRPEKLKHLVPLKRPGTANEIAEAVLWLLSDKASYTTGSILDVGGGR